MSESVPYLASPGSITKCLEKISNAATPEKVTGDFVVTKLGIKGGTGRALVPFLKRIGFVKTDGTPSDLYVKYRNPSEAAGAIAGAMRIGYSVLYEYNEYAHELGDQELRGLIVQVTGQEAKSSAVNLTVSTFKRLKELADFDLSPAVDIESPPVAVSPAANSNSVKTPSIIPHATGSLGLNLSYTINLNLPATSDISVFNAIFKSLKDNLLQSDESE